jgi:putative tryptophan/tyrosine transport system substrate-binding protein
MRRREFITLIGGAAAAQPLTAHAQQQPAMPVVGFLSLEASDPSSARMRAFYRGLNESGYVEGRNIKIDYRWAEGKSDRLPALAKELIDDQVMVISTTSTPALLAAKAVTNTIPIVCFTGIDLVQAGLIASLARPGGNLTGVTTMNVEIGPKRLELLHELLPKATVAALLVNPTNPVIAETLTKDARATASALGLQLHVLRASSKPDFETVFTTLVQLQVAALVIGVDLFFVSQSEQLASLTVHHRIPAIFITQEFTAAGGLMSYAGSISDAFRLVGAYTGRVLKGEKPANLPVLQATKIELIINLKTAKALGLTVPVSLLGRADEVIE